MLQTGAVLTVRAADCGSSPVFVAHVCSVGSQDGALRARLTSLLHAAGCAASRLRYRSSATRRASMKASVMRRPSIKFLSGRAGRKLQAATARMRPLAVSVSCQHSCWCLTMCKRSTWDAGCATTNELATTHAHGHTPDNTHLPCSSLGSRFDRLTTSLNLLRTLKRPPLKCGRLVVVTTS